MPRADVVHGLDLCIDVAERESRIRIDPLDQIVEIAAADRRKPRSLAAGDRTFSEHGRARAAQARASAELVAAAFASCEADLGAHLPARALRIAAGQQGDAAQRLAVDHRDRAAVGDAVDGVHQIPRRDAVHHQTDVAERIAAHRELAVEVVGRCRGWQGLDRPEWIVEHRAAQRFELAAVERRAAGDRIGLAPKRARHAHALGIGSGACREPNRHVERRFSYVDLGAQQGVADDRCGDRLAATRRRQAESAVGVCFGAIRHAFDVDRHTSDWHLGAIVDHDAGDRAGLVLRMDGGGDDTDRKYSEGSGDPHRAGREHDGCQSRSSREFRNGEGIRPQARRLSSRRDGW